jgi:hypothetical protein
MTSALLLVAALGLVAAAGAWIAAADPDRDLRRRIGGDR